MDKNAVIVDFFAASGVTGQAIMEQNLEDGRQRRYILVQLPEPLDPESKDQAAAAQFCDKLGKPSRLTEPTKERLRRAGKQVREEKPLFAGDLGSRVFKLASSNIRAWEPDPTSLTETLQESIEHLDPDRTKADILFELLLKLGLDLTVPTLAPAGETTVVFRDSAFADDVAKSNLTAILQQHGLENVRSL